MISNLKPTFRVPATRGKMGKTEYYTATLPFGVVTKLFTFDPAAMLELSPEYRSQRALKSKRVPEIARYIIDHDDYIFSAITVSVDSDEVEFRPVEEADIGVLVLPLEAKYVINDGQHRVAGISEALLSDPTLARDTISVVVLPDGGLERSQQIFSDLNRTVHKTSKSLDILYDHRLPINRITMACMDQVDLFQKRIDKERVSLSIRSPKFATLSGLQQANKQLLGNPDERLSPTAEKKLTSWAIDYWNILADLVEPWNHIRDGDMKPQEARQEYISSYALALWAFGAVGKAVSAAAKQANGNRAELLSGLTKIDWRTGRESAWPSMRL
ncbi:MAG: DNA sulfur modification protein DndB [Acidimicrobiia bacterium]|nr:DNA sulfur modification protein DndB [Acidimicrobiia bacterium]